MERYTIGKKILFEENHKIIDGQMYKLCSICSTWKMLNRENFYINKTNKTDGFNTYCIGCTKAKSDKWAQDNWDRRTAIRRKSDKNPNAKIKRREVTRKKREKGYFTEYFKINPEKQSEYRNKRNLKRHNITAIQWDACRLYFNYRCAYCGKTWEQNYLETKKDLHKEHVDDDGANDLSNCVPACRNCNSHKWEFEFDDWYNKDNPVYDEPRYSKIIKWINEDFINYDIR